MRDRDAFATWYRQERVDLLCFASLVCRDADLAEDIVAEAMVRMWPKLRKGRVDDAGKYARRTIARLVIDRERRRSVIRRYEDTRRRVVDPVGVTSPVEDRLHVWPLLLELAAEQRVVLVLRFFEDRSEAEIAQLLGVPVGTVKSRCSRGLATLRELLGSAARDKEKMGDG